MRYAAKVLSVVLSTCLAVYVGVFSYWWLSAKTTVAFVNGQRQVVVRVHENRCMRKTYPIWTPAFWFMEHVFGYRYAGYIAAMEDSAIVYEK